MLHLQSPTCHECKVGHATEATADLRSPIRIASSVMSGFICQSLGIAFEACRLVAIQKLLHGLKMDPLVSLYYFAPVRCSLSQCSREGRRT